MFYPNDRLVYYLESRKPSLNKNVHLGTNECVDAMCYTQIIIWENYFSHWPRLLFMLGMEEIKEI